MWRTVIVNRGERLTIKENKLVVYSDAQEYKIPVEDIYALVIDNREIMLSVSVLTCLTEAGAHIFYCDEKHIPVSLTLPLDRHFRPLGVLTKQMEMPSVLKKELWTKIVRQKIYNQYKCLKYAGVSGDRCEIIRKISETVSDGDMGNKEAVAAKKYFPFLFGSTFKRSDEDITNAALNYGYSILRSSVCKTLVAYGFNCVLGLHHINANDPFNLAEDIMEPLRPVVDLWTDENCDDLLGELTKTNRRELIDLVNNPIQIGGKKMKLRNAIDVYVKSLVTAINENDAERLLLPELLPLDALFEEDE